MIYALDTNIVTALLKDNGAVLNHATIATSHGNELIIPPIVDYEIRRGLADERFQKRLARFDKLLEVIRIGTFNLPVWRKAAQIYHSLAMKGNLIEDADILIAAFCIINSYTLVSNNLRHFERVPDLKFVDWIE